MARADLSIKAKGAEREGGTSTAHVGGGSATAATGGAPITAERCEGRGTRPVTLFTARGFQAASVTACTRKIKSVATVPGLSTTAPSATAEGEEASGTALGGVTEATLFRTASGPPPKTENEKSITGGVGPLLPASGTAAKIVTPSFISRASTATGGAD